MSSSISQKENKLIKFYKFLTQKLKFHDLSSAKSKDNDEIATHFPELLTEMRNVIDPGPRDEHLFSCIEDWCNSHGITEKQLVQHARVLVKTNLEYACLLGLCYHYGVGTSRNYKKAFKYYSKAAHFGDRFGMNQLGWCFRKQLGTKSNLVLSTLWYQRSAASGDPTGQCNLAFCLYEGNGIKANKYIAFKLFEKSAIAGIDTSQQKVAKLYLHGIGTERDIHKAIKCCRDWMNTSDNRVFSHHIFR
ncbi:3777_t:CDS:2 [Ambispora gerdemannii]|uniref:3777_t:CDS:1 n=1 Tax=Ambispora gerdemannii TaxID=144530 RepID=A0A9N9A9B6_9GLOM|nr:3777_t:CDS:2 [Ambispora gerdemannii]